MHRIFRCTVCRRDEMTRQNQDDLTAKRHRGLGAARSLPHTRGIKRALKVGMKRYLRYVLTLLAILLMAAIGAFFFYVALVPLALASLILVGLAVMFALGVYVGTESLPRLGNSFRSVRPGLH